MKNMASPKRQIAVIVGTSILLVSVVAFAADHAKSKPAPLSPTPVSVAAAGAQPPLPLAASPAAATNLALATVVATPVPAPALTSDTQTSVPSDDAAYNHLVSQLEKEQYVLTLQSKNADLKKKIADSQGDVSLPAPQSVIVAPPASMTPQNGVPSNPARGGASSITFPDPSAPALPSQAPLRLASVFSAGGNYVATVIDHGVSINDVHVGRTLSDGWYVESVAPSTVELSRGRRHLILHVGD